MSFLARIILPPVMIASACTIPVKPLTPVELDQAASVDMEQIFGDSARIEGALSLDDAIMRTLSMNLDRRLARLEEAYALGQRYVDQWDMLPEMAVNAGYNYRSEYYATTSSGIDGKPFDSEPNYSSPKNSFTTDLTATWNLLDLAVGYYNAKQSGNRALVAAERRRRAEMNLVRETNTAYWRALAAQRLADKVDETIRSAESALEMADESVNFGLQDPLNELRLRKTVLEALRQLESLRQELAIARIELAQLVRARPDAEITLAAEEMTLPVVEESAADLVRIAFLNNPDIREQMYRVRVATDDTRKAMVDFLPQLTPSLGVNYDDNRFLDENTWISAGLGLSWNLFRVISVPARVEHAQKAVEVEKIRQLAIRMAVLGQTHIALNQFRAAIQQFKRSKTLFEVEEKLVRETVRRAEVDFRSDVELVVTRTSAIMAELRMHQSYARVRAEHAALMATIGNNAVADRFASEERMKQAAEAAMKGEEPEETINTDTISVINHAR